MRAEGRVQFAPVEIPPTVPAPPGWLERALADLAEMLGEWLAPVGQVLGNSWAWLQWAMLGCAVLIAAVLLMRVLAARLARPSGTSATAPAKAEGWQPGRAETIALLDDADRLAAQGRYEAATRLLLQHSIGHIADAHPAQVEPASTARELAALPVLSATARAAFAIMAERVERSLFARRMLDRGDWDAARAAYADFALAALEPHPAAQTIRA